MTSDRTIKVGIHGAGGHAQNNYPLNLTQLEGMEVVAVCNIVEKNARQTAADSGMSRSYTNPGFEEDRVCVEAMEAVS